MRTTTPDSCLSPQIGYLFRYPPLVYLFPYLQLSWRVYPKAV